MKPTTYLPIALITLTLGACSFSAGTNKDLATGLSHSYKGFAVERVVLAGPDNKAMSSNEVQYGTQIAIVAEGLANYELKEDKAFPGLILTVTDKAGTTIMGGSDLFAESTGYSVADAAILRGTVTVGEPMKAGETYHVNMRVWDKNKPGNELTADVDLVVK